MHDGGRTALVIDPEAEIRGVLRAGLESIGFRVYESTTGQDVVAAVAACDPDLITLDVEPLKVRPLGGGPAEAGPAEVGPVHLEPVEVGPAEVGRLDVVPLGETLESCRRIRELSDAYLIVITNARAEADRLAAFAAGADDYVTKPFSLREVQARVEAMFRRPRTAGLETGAGASPGAKGVLWHGRLCVDVEGRSAWLGPVELSLTRTEFDLLAALAGNPGRVWRRASLLGVVWGGGWSDHHVVEVHMGNLRRKLGVATDGGAELIRTVRGVGYRLAPLAPAAPTPQYPSS